MEIRLLNLQTWASHAYQYGPILCCSDEMTKTSKISLLDTAENLHFLRFHEQEMHGTSFRDILISSVNRSWVTTIFSVFYGVCNCYELSPRDVNRGKGWSKFSQAKQEGRSISYPSNGQVRRGPILPIEKSPLPRENWCSAAFVSNRYIYDEPLSRNSLDRFQVILGHGYWMGCWSSIS